MTRCAMADRVVDCLLCLVLGIFLGRLLSVVPDMRIEEKTAWLVFWLVCLAGGLAVGKLLPGC